MPPVAMGEKVVTGIGTSSPNLACAADTDQRANLRIREHARRLSSFSSR